MKMILGGLGGLYAHTWNAAVFSAENKKATRMKLLLLEKKPINTAPSLPVIRAYFFLWRFFLSFVEMISFALVGSRAIQKTTTVYLIIIGSVIISFLVFLFGPEAFFESSHSFHRDSALSFLMRILFLWGYTILISFHPMVRDVFCWQKSKNIILSEHHKSGKLIDVSSVCEFTYVFILLSAMIFFYSLPVSVLAKSLLFVVGVPLLYESMLRYESELYYFIGFFSFFVNKTPSDSQLVWSKKFFSLLERVDASPALSELSLSDVDVERVY